MPSLPSPADTDTLDDLPVGVYVVAPSGQIRYANKSLRRLLALPSTGPLLHLNLTDYYEPPTQRDEIIQVVLDAEEAGREPPKQTVAFRVRGVRKPVDVICQSLRSPQGHLLGFRGCLVDISDELRAHELVDLLDVGMYRLDSQGLITRSNKALARLLGYATADKMVGTRLADHLADPATSTNEPEATNLLGAFSGRVLETLPLTGTRFFESYSSLPVLDQSGQPVGYEGTVTDVSSEEQYRTLVEQAPLGVYMIHSLGGQDIIVHCNDHFARLFDLADSAAAIGRDIRELHRKHSLYGDFLEQLHEAHKRDQPLVGHEMRVVTSTGKQRILEVSAALTTNRLGKVVGRIGILRDVSAEAQLRATVRAFSKDLGTVLHSYSTHLHSIKPALAATRRALLRDLEFQHKPIALASVQDSLPLVASGAERSLVPLIQTFERLGDKATASEAERLRKLLRSRPTFEELRAPFLRRLASQILETAARQEATVPKDLMRRLRTDTWQLERLCSSLAVDRVLQAIHEMEYPIRAFREYMISQIQRDEPTERRLLSDILQAAIANVAEYAASAGVQLFAIGETRVHVLAVEGELVRALSNLLHNAIKYSWTRSRGEEPWVEIRVTKGTADISVQIENFGVGIPPDEIESGFIFRTGTRGRLAGDRGRTGTGIGLADAREIAKRIGGRLSVESRPATSAPVKYEGLTPFVTAATLTVPIASLETASGNG